jgi:hypothetical protein
MGLESALCNVYLAMCLASVPLRVMQKNGCCYAIRMQQPVMLWLRAK